MAKTNKIVSVLSVSALAGVMASVIVSSSAFAAVHAYTVKVGDVVYEYNTMALQESFLASKAGSPSVLYTNFTKQIAAAKEFYAFHDGKTGRYIGNDNVTNAFLADRANFKLDTYVESDKAVAVANLPQVIKAVSVVGGEIVLTDKQTSGVTIVTSVSAISKTGIDVVLPKATKAVEGFTIVVKNPSGTVVPVKPMNIEIGDAALTFEFVTPLTAIAVGNWNVGGVTYDTGAQVAVEAVLNATTQIQLLNALNSSYFTGVKATSIVTYETILQGLTSDQKATVALIQKNVILAGNTVGTEASAVKAVKDATNQIELYTALSNSYFSRVNADFIADYDGALDGTSETTVALVQADIDAVNMTKAVASVVAAELGLSRTDVNSASVLVANLKADVSPATAKKALVDRLAIQTALIVVNEANTNAKLTAALSSLAKLSIVIDLDTVNEALLTNYRVAIAAATVVNKNAVSDIQGFITAANSAAEAVAVTNLAAVTLVNTTTIVQFKELASKLDVLSSTFDATKILDAKVLGVGGYIDTIDTATITNAADLEAIIVAVNAPLVAVQNVQTVINGTETADTLLAALKATTLTLTNIIDANKAQYLADVADIDTATDGTNATTAVASVAALKKVIAASNSVVELNAATTASAARTIITSFALSTGNTTFVNLSTIAKLEVAELVLAAKTTAGVPFATSASVTTVIGSKVTAQASLVAATNAATTISDMDIALDGLKYAAYDTLSVVKQLEVAESFLAAFPKATVTPFAKINYTTMTAIRADVDKAILATK